MKDVLNKLSSKLDRLDNRLDKMTIVMVKQEENLKEHMRRTELLENQNEAFQQSLEPVKSHVDQVRGAAKLIGLIGAITAILGVVLKTSL